MIIEELKKEYATQDNRGTAYPFYVQVQELRFVGVIADGYSVSCPFGDGETKEEFKHPDYEGTYDNEQELLDEMVEGNGKEYANNECANIEVLNCGYVWHPVEFFLTIKGAEEYMAANKHNHGKLRTYVSCFERRNYEMRRLLKELGFKTQDSVEATNE